jgi:hypothetical protein
MESLLEVITIVRVRASHYFKEFVMMKLILGKLYNCGYERCELLWGLELKRL